MIIRPAILLLLLCTLLSPALAQSDFDPDELINDITVGMTRADVEATAAEMGWLRMKRSARSLTYVRPQNPKGSGSITISFQDSVVSTVSVTMKLHGPQTRKWAVMILDDARKTAMRNAESILEEGKRTIFTHTTSNGSTMKHTWTKTGKYSARLDVEVIPPGR